MSNLEREVERVINRALRESSLSGGAPIGILDGVEAFLAAITWSEPFILGILLFHTVFLFVSVLGRKKTLVQIGLLVIALLGVLSASYLNDYGARHWRKMGVSQNYFDKTGVFTSLLISAPLIVMSFGILIHAVARASSLLITVKRLELAKNKSQKEQQQGASSKSTATPPTTTTTTTTRVQTAEAMSAGDVDGQVPPSDATSSSSSTKQRRGKGKAN